MVLDDPVELFGFCGAACRTPPAMTMECGPGKDVAFYTRYSRRQAPGLVPVMRAKTREKWL